MSEASRPHYLHKIPPCSPTAALNALASKLQADANRARASAIAAAYSVGAGVAAVLADDSEVFDHEPTERLAVYLGFTRDELDRICAVYHDFDSDFIESCLHRKTSRGNLISLSHLLVLAPVRDDDTRIELIESFYSKDLSVEDLKGLIWADSEVIKVRKWRPPDPETPLMVAMELTRAMQRLNNYLDFWDGRLLDKIQADCPNNMFTILMRRLEEAATGVSENLGRLMKIDGVLSEAMLFLEKNRIAPQDPDPREEQYPKPHP